MFVFVYFFLLPFHIQESREPSALLLCMSALLAITAAFGYLQIRKAEYWERNHAFLLYCKCFVGDIIFFSRLPFQELGRPRVKFACALYVCSYNFLLIIVILLANVYWRCWWYLLFCACWLFLDSGKQRVQRACALFARATCSRNSQTPPALPLASSRRLVQLLSLCCAASVIS